MDIFLSHGVPHRTVANFIAGVRFTARSEFQVTNSELGEALTKSRDKISNATTIKISGKQVVEWGSENKLIKTPIDHPTLLAVLNYCIENKLCPNAEEGFKGLCDVHRVLKKNSDFPDFIKKRLARGNGDEH